MNENSGIIIGVRAHVIVVGGVYFSMKRNDVDKNKNLIKKWSGSPMLTSLVAELK